MVHGPWSIVPRILGASLVGVVIRQIMARVYHDPISAAVSDGLEWMPFPPNLGTGQLNNHVTN